MEKNKNMEISFDIMATNNENKDNLNSSLTSLNLNESNIDDQDIDTDKAETSAIPTKNTSISIRSLPVRNVPEKIIFCVDTGVTPENTTFQVEKDNNYSVLTMLKRVIEMFVHNKSFIDSRHEYALLTIDSKDVNYIRDFSNNPTNIINDLESDEIFECKTSEAFDISSILEKVLQNVNIPKPMNPLHLPPPYIVRLILLYSRSSFSFNGRKKFEELLNNPYFTVDVIYIHEPCSEAKQVFHRLQKLDDKQYSYQFHVGKNVTMLHDSMAKLLAHPLQRQIQSEACYEINQETQMNWKKVDKEE